MSTPFYLAFAALWILVVAHSLILLGVVRMVYQLKQTGAVTDDENVGLKTGQVAPPFSVTDLAGAAIDSTAYAGRMRALLFVSPNCPSCTASLYEMEALNHKAQGSVIVFCRGAREDCVRLTELHGLDAPTVADEDDRIFRLYGIAALPTAVLIDERDQIQSYGEPKREDFEQVGQAVTNVPVVEAVGVG